MNTLHPSSIAVIGASSQEGKVGHDVLKNLVMQGYEGQIYPVNPKGGEILGKTAYGTVTDIPTTPDLAIIVIPAKLVPASLKECGEKGIKNVVVISAGFSEVHTDEGKTLELELITIAKQYSINLIGPNCLGVVRPSIKMNASFAKDMPPAGSIALISQSGATAVALMDAAPSYGLGLSMMLSIGNKAVLDECDYLELCENDPETRVIGFYLESIKDGTRFLDVASRVAQTKPIVLLKSGVSEHGRKAASSHTGALAGSDAAIDALCRESGIHRAHTSEEFFDLLAVLSTQPTLATNRIAIITNAGGPGILATDAAAKSGLTLPALQEKIGSALKEKLPAAASIGNPIDVIGDAGADRYDAAINACQVDPSIDGLAIILTPQVMTPVTEIAKLIVKLSKENPLMPIVTSFMGGESVNEARSILRENGIPSFDTPERAINALAALYNPSSTLGMTQGRRVMVSVDEPDTSAHAAEAQSLIAKTSGLLDEDTTAKLFALYNLPLPRQDVAHSAEEAIAIAERIGYPVIAKVSSPHILHKTDVGGIRANLQNGPEVAQAFHEIMSNGETYLKAQSLPLTASSVLIQQFLPVGNEFIVGAIRDPSFGPLIMVGLGGIYTELFADTAFRIAPVNEREAYEMLTELTSWKLLLGLRGKPQSDIDALASTIAKVSQLVTDCPQITELDLNPVLVSTDGVVVADAKVVIG